jgi:hypothetical protein
MNNHGLEDLVSLEGDSYSKIDTLAVSLQLAQGGFAPRFARK